MLLEECELAWWAWSCLRGRIAAVEVCDPRRNRWIFQDAVKSDEVDAEKLSEIRRLGCYRVVHQPQTEDLAAFKKLVSHYQKLTQEQAGLKCQIRARLRREGIFTSGSSLFDPDEREEYLKLVKHPVVRGVLAEQLELLDHVLEIQGRALRRVRRGARRLPIVKMLQEVPGVGAILASVFVAYIQTPHRFKSRRQLWRYCRLGVSERSSDGKRLGRKRLDRRGVGCMKALSRTAFIAALRCRDDNALQRFYRASLQRTGNPTHARLNTQRKLLSIMWSMWRNGTEYQDDYESSCELKDTPEAL